MRKILLALILVLFMAVSVFADVTATIVKVDKDENGNIRVWTQYKVDGVEVESRYPKIDGKSVYCTRYNVMNFAGMDKVEIKNRVLADLNSHAENLIRKAYILKANDVLLPDIDKAIGLSITKDTTDIQVDTDKDGVADTIWTVKSDGTKIETPIISP